MSETVMHPVGNYTYPFNFPLSTDIPSSYEGRRGYVRYTCKAILDRPWKFDESIKEPSTVVRQLDCNKLINALVVMKQCNVTKTHIRLQKNKTKQCNL